MPTGSASVPKLLPGADIKAIGGYVIAPPSLHASGVRYEWLRDPASSATRTGPRVDTEGLWTGEIRSDRQTVGGEWLAAAKPQASTRGSVRKPAGSPVGRVPVVTTARLPSMANAPRSVPPP